MRVALVQNLDLLVVLHSLSNAGQVGTSLADDLVNRDVLRVRQGRKWIYLCEGFAKEDASVLHSRCP